MLGRRDWIRISRRGSRSSARRPQRVIRIVFGSERIDVSVPPVVYRFERFSSNACSVQTGRFCEFTAYFRVQNRTMGRTAASGHPPTTS
eukprot:1184782-Prymnesium_polylepis.1